MLHVMKCPSLCHKAFGDTKIEDCWLSYACVTVDLSVSEERIHQNGTLWR